MVMSNVNFISNQFPQTIELLKKKMDSGVSVLTLCDNSSSHGHGALRDRRSVITGSAACCVITV